eukprot:4601135-Amphidinium_carterae.1
MDSEVCRSARIQDGSSSKRLARLVFKRRTPYQGGLVTAAGVVDTCIQCDSEWQHRAQIEHIADMPTDCRA